MTNLPALREAVAKYEAWASDDREGYDSLLGIACETFNALPALLDELEALKALVRQADGLLHHTLFWTPDDGQQHPHPDCPACQWQTKASAWAAKEQT